MKNVTVTVRTKAQKFPGDVQDENFLYELVNKSKPQTAANEPVVDTAPVVRKSPNTTMVFENVPNGSYEVRVSKLGVVANGSFDSGADDAEINVPDSLSIVLGDPTGTIA